MHTQLNEELNVRVGQLRAQEYTQNLPSDLLVEERLVRIFPYQFAVVSTLARTDLVEARLSYDGVVIVCESKASNKMVVLNMPGLEVSNYNIINYILNQATNVLLSELAIGAINSCSGYVIGSERSVNGYKIATKILSSLQNCKLFSDLDDKKPKVEGFIDTVTVSLTGYQLSEILIETETSKNNNALRRQIGLTNAFLSNSTVIDRNLKATQEVLLVDNGYLNITMMELLKTAGVSLFTKANSYNT